MLTPSNSSSIFAGLDIGLRTSFLLFILVPIAGLVIAAIMNHLSSQVSRIAVYHAEEPMHERIRNLFSVYFSMGCIMYAYGAITLVSTVDGVRLSDPNIAFVIIVVACMLPLAVRIITTTQMVSTSKLEQCMEIGIETIRERYLSLLNSYFSIVLTVAIFGVVYLFKLMMDGEELNTMVSAELTFSTTGLFYVLAGSLIFPLAAATIGELMRYVVVRIYGRLLGIELPDGLMIEKHD